MRRESWAESGLGGAFEPGSGEGLSSGPLVLLPGNMSLTQSKQILEPPQDSSAVAQGQGLGICILTSPMREWF